MSNPLIEEVFELPAPDVWVNRAVRQGNNYYMSDGKEWSNLGVLSEVVFVQVGNDVLVGKTIEFGEGNNIKLTIADGKLIIGTHGENTTSIKNGHFIIKGEHIEVVAGRGITISTAMPNRLVISCNMDKYVEEVEALKKRFVVIEGALTKLLKAIKKPEAKT